MNTVTRLLFATCVVATIVFFSTSFAQKQQPSKDVMSKGMELLKNYKIPAPSNPPEVETPQQSWERRSREQSKFTNKPTVVPEQKIEPAETQYLGGGSNKKLIDQFQQQSSQQTPEKMRAVLEEKIRNGEVKDYRTLSIEEQKKQLQDKIQRGEVKDMRQLSVEEMKWQLDEKIQKGEVKDLRSDEQKNIQGNNVQGTRRDGRTLGEELSIKPKATINEKGWTPIEPFNDISNFQIIHNADMVAAGYGGMRTIGTGTLTLAGVSGTIQKAYLYWSGPTLSLNPNANANVMFAGNPVTGVNIGFSNDNCWGGTNSQAYRADVTSLVTGNGSYSLAGFLQSDADINGVSLIVFFNDGNSANDRDFVIFDGNDSNINNPYDAVGWNVLLSGINYTSGTANVVLHVGDGQSWVDDNLYINGLVLAPGPQVFAGNTVPNGPSAANTNGGLWDIKTFDITSYMSPGINNFLLTTGYATDGDCLGLVAAIVDLPAGSAPQEFGTAKIQGMKFNDTNGDSLKGVDEPGLQGWIIRLHQGDSLVSTVITDPMGNYTFANLLPGTYTVSESLKNGWNQTVPATPGTYTVIVDSGQIVTGKDFGNKMVATNFVSGMKFHDLNANGQKDSGEPGLAGWTINAYGYYYGGQWSAVTDNNGNYTIAIVSQPDYYRVDETGQAGWLQTVGNWGWDWLTANGDTIHVDFGNRLAFPNYFTGMKFNDLDRNGLKDSGEPGLPGWTITVNGYNTGGSWSAVTDSNGMYFITSHSYPDYYFINETNQTGWTQTLGNYSWIYRNAVGDTGVYDFGNRANYPNYFTGMKFNDINHNGVKDQGEPGMAGWTITVSGYYNGGSWSAVTDTNGMYFIATHAYQDYYFVNETNQPGWYKTTPAYDWWYQYATGDTAFNTDFGNWLVPLGSIRGMKFHDLNYNYSKDPGEPGIPGWTIHATKQSDGTIYTTVTDANGMYAFDSLTMVSYYTVSEEQQMDWIQTYPNGNWSFQVAGDTVVDINFGNYLPPQGPLRVNTLPSYSVNTNYGNALAGVPLAVWGNVHGGVVPLQYVLDYGDGTIESGTVTYRRYIGTNHTYATAGYYSMTLTITDNLGAVDVDGSVVRVFAGSTPEIQRNMAIERGLLYDYLHQYADGHFTGSDAQAATGASVLSFEENGHLPNNNINTDIYAEYVKQGLDYLFSTAATSIIYAQTAGNPDSDGDGIGSFLSGSVYANGIALLSVIGAHPSAISAQADIITVGPYNGQSYYEFIVDALDQIAFSQTDVGEYGRGGWRYTANYASNGSSDNSAVQWHSLVIEAAEKLWGRTIQPFVKSELLIWLQYSQDGSGGFGYTDPGNWNNPAKTGSGIGSYAALDYLSTSAPVTNAISFLDAYWNYDNFGNLYAMYAVKKGMSIIDNRSGVSLIGAHNWRDEYNSYLVSTQGADGSWSSTWVNGPDALSTSFGVLILTPGVSQLRPVAVIAPISSKPPNTSFAVDGSGSHHMDPNKTIIEYLWDWDVSNGVDWNNPDAVGPNPTNPGYPNNGTYTISLRVKDNSDPALFDYDTKQVIVQSTNNPPVAVPIPFARGPVYAARVGEPILLDGRDSYDPDYPADSVIAFNWDTNGDGIHGDVTTDTITVVFNNEYNGQVGLRVYDTHNDSSTNNAYITIVSSRKDIFVEQFIVNPGFGSSGDSLDFFAVFKNDDLSNLNVMNVLVRFYDENPRTTGNQIGGDFYVDLPIGTRDSVSTRLKLPTLPSGARSLYVYLDANDNFAEWDEVNNFGSFQFSVGSFASILGQKFEDVNGNGEKDVDEPGIPNWKIFLGGARNDSTITDVNGNYSFGYITPGTYTVSEDDESLWVQTKPANPNYYTINASLDSAYMGNDFGNFHVGTISGMKFLDVNRDSLKGESEPGLEGWTINLIGVNGTVSTVTDANGNYSFTNVGPGEYDIEEVIEPGWFQTFPKSIVYEVSMLSNSNLYGYDFGNYQSMTISGMKFNDLNGNGVKETGEPGLPNWKIVLQGAIAETTSTAIDGTYQFTITSEGTYTVTEIQQAGWVQTTPSYPPFTVVFGQNVTDVDFGNYKQPKITGMKFEDLNGNGIKEQGEPGLSGWTIKGTKGQSTKTTVTGGDGSYTMLFDSTEIGSWTISEILQQNWQQTFPANGTYSVNIQSGVEVNNLDFGNFLPASISGQKFNDMNGDSLTSGDPTLNGWTIQLWKGEVLVGTVVTSGNGNYSFGNLMPGNYNVMEVVQQGWVRTAPQGGVHLVTLTSGMNVTGKDFANFKLVSISGMKFHDYDGDSIKDVNESGLPDWQILLQKDGVPFDTAITDANGNYSFTELFAGEYNICEEVVEGWYQTKPTSECYSETIVSGGNLADRDFGNFEFGTIAGYKFFDHDSAGDFDTQFDDFLDSLRVVLIGTHTQPETVLTDANGQFLFGQVPADNYTIKEVPRALWRQTYPTLGASYSLTMVSGLDTSGFVFGNFYMPDTGKYRTFMRTDYYKAASAKPRGKTQIKKPNAGNIRDSVFLNRGYGWDSPIDSGYLRVGVRRYDSTDCYGWFFFPYDSIREKTQRKRGYHAPSVSKYQFAKPWKKEPKTNYSWWTGEINTSSQFANATNHLGFELLTLKTNVAASDLGHTPVGLGDLVFDRISGPDTIFNNMTIRQIIAQCDTALTMGIKHCPAPAPVDTMIPISRLIIMDSVVTRLNRDFWKALDSRKFTDSISTSPLRFKGAVALYKVPYLKRDVTKVSALTRFIPTVTQSAIPYEYLLEQNYPNPFNPKTVIRYQLSVTSTVTLKIYDMLGREVVSMADNEIMDEGDYEMEFDASDLASGVYFYRLLANGTDDNSATFVDVKKMLLVK